MSKKVSDLLPYEVFGICATLFIGYFVLSNVLAELITPWVFPRQGGDDSFLLVTLAGLLLLGMVGVALFVAVWLRRRRKDD